MKINEFINNDIVEDRIDYHYKRRNKEVHEVLGLLKKYNHKLIGKIENKEVFFSLYDVYYFESVDKKTFAYLKDKVLKIEDSLIDVEKAYFEFGLIRVNKSTVLNIYKVDTIKSELNMKVIAILDNDEKVQINRSYKAKFTSFLKAMSNGGIENEIDQ